MDALELDLPADLILNSHQALDNDIVDLAPHQVNVYAFLLKMLVKGREGPLVSRVFFFCFLKTCNLLQ